MASLPFSYKVFVLLSTLVLLFSLFNIVWSSPPKYPQVRRQSSISNSLPTSNQGRSAEEARFCKSTKLNRSCPSTVFGNFMLPNFESWGNLFNLNGSVISFVPLGQMLFSG